MCEKTKKFSEQKGGFMLQHWLVVLLQVVAAARACVVGLLSRLL